MNIKMLLKLISEYNPGEEKSIYKAYAYAKKKHEGQKRESGEDYIIHPLNVAYTLADMHADKNTICAALLHDTLEDTNTTKEELTQVFSPDIASLVDGVTKISKNSITSPKDRINANTRKIITSLSEDVRIVIIKLADRLHNMQTLQYKNETKQKQIAEETLKLYVPLAFSLGAYHIKHELEDLCLFYLNPDKYNEIRENENVLIDNKKDSILKIYDNIEKNLKYYKINGHIGIHSKNVYGIYTRLNKGLSYEEIHDLITIRIGVDTIDECYRTLGIVHNLYHPINEQFRDYISTPKTNMYKGLHTTIFGPDDNLVQIQIRTKEMEMTSSNGLLGYWNLCHGEARTNMQNDISKKFQFYTTLKELDESLSNNDDFINEVNSEVLADKVYVYTTKGDIIELPVGSTPIDFAYKLNDFLGDLVTDVYVNGNRVAWDYVLKDKDRIRVIIDNNIKVNRDDWENIAKTSYAKVRIKNNKNK